MQDTDEIFSKAVGKEIRLIREDRKLSRDALSKELPSNIGSRTILSYEHGTRRLTVSRLVEICIALRVSPAEIINRAMQHIKVEIQNITIQIDLHKLINDDNPVYVIMRDWARNRLVNYSGNVAELTNSSIRNFATLINCNHQDLSAYLCNFTPTDYDYKRY